MKNKTSNFYNEKFQEVRGKLDKLKYNYHMDYSSLQLADALITDIKIFISQIEKLKEDTSKLQNENENMNIQLKAYKSENQKMIKENNELHRELVEITKTHFSSNSSKSIEVKRLSEEKNDFKFLYSNMKKKTETIMQENEELKKRLSFFLVKIYEGNMDEKSLRALYENSKEETLGNNNSDLGIFVKPRGLNMNMNLNLGVTQGTASGGTGFKNNQLANDHNLNNEENINRMNETNLLKEAIKQTFTNSNLNTLEEKLLKTMSINTIENKTKFINTLDEDFLKLQGKVHTLENEVKIKDTELTRIHRYLKTDTPNKDTEMMLIFLKQENKNIVEKYEKRLEIINNENKHYERMFGELSSKIKNYENHHPYIKELKRKITQLSKINEEVLSYKNILEGRITELTSDNEKLQNLIKNYKNNYIDKNFVLVNEDKFRKLNEDYVSNQHLIKRLDDRIQEIRANSNSTENTLKNEIKNLKLQLDVLNNQFENSKQEIEKLKKEKEEDLENNNYFQMNKLKKEHMSNDFKEKIDQMTQKCIEIENEKAKIKENVRDLNDKLILSKKEILLKENEIERLNNMNYVMEKQIEILENKK